MSHASQGRKQSDSFGQSDSLGRTEGNRTEGKFQILNPYQGARILRRGIQEMLQQWPQPLNL